MTAAVEQILASLWLILSAVLETMLLSYLSGNQVFYEGLQYIRK